MTRPPFGIVGVSLGILLAACPPPGGGPDGGERTGLPSGLAVLSSDYQVSTVSLVDPVTLEVVREGCVDSAFTAPGLSQALTGDVVLPSTPQGGALVLVDRQNAALTWVDPGDCTVDAQRSVGLGAALNPHDVLRLPDGRVYVTRYNPNPAPDADPSKLDDGDDVLVLDASGAPAASIALPDVEVEGQAPVYARPERLLAWKDRVYVSLGRQSGDHHASAPGEVAILDPATDALVGTVSLAPLTVCGGMSVSSAGLLVVSCGGSFASADQAAESGLAFVDLAADPPTVTVRVSKTVLAGRPANFAFATLLGDGRAAVGTVGSLQAPVVPDALHVLGVTGSAEKWLESNGAFELGRAAFDPGTGRLFVPVGDDRDPRVEVLHESGSRVTTLDATPTTHLPPREIAAY